MSGKRLVGVIVFVVSLLVSGIDVGMPNTASADDCLTAPNSSRRRREPTGTTTWIGQISASAGTCVPSANPRNKRLPRPHPKPRPLHNRIRCQCPQDQCLRRQQQALRCQ